MFLFQQPAATDTYTLSLHDALPISAKLNFDVSKSFPPTIARTAPVAGSIETSADEGSLERFKTCADAFPACVCRADRKSKRLNSSHVEISYAVFCLKKKNTHVEHAL